MARPTSRKQTDRTMLDLKMLNDMPGHTCFATGTGEYPLIERGRIRWAATRGGINDWAVYYDREDKTVQEVLESGSKVVGPNNIRMLVPCDDEALKRYRY